jgi:hypothetical protein
MRRAVKIIGIGMLLKILGIAVLMILSSIFAESFSVEFTPNEVPVCGPYPNMSMVTARVLNNGSYTATNLTLVFTANQTGLTGVSGGTYHLDSLEAGSYSSVLSWAFGCGNAPPQKGRIALNILATQ